MKAAIYARVSTVDKDQLPWVQIDLLLPWLERLGYEPTIFVEEGVSGAKESRPVLNNLLDRIRRREFAAIAVQKLDRLGRSLQHLLQLLAEFDVNQCRLLVHDAAMDTATPQGKLFFQMAGAFAEYERSMIAERVKAGMGYAAEHGTKSGKPIGRPRLDVDPAAVRAFLDNGGSINAAARVFGVSRPWVYANVGKS